MNHVIDSHGSIICQVSTKKEPQFPKIAKHTDMASISLMASKTRDES